MANLKFYFMKIMTQEILNGYHDEIYFFILKKVKNKDATNEIFQNSFLKIHKNINQIKELEKVKAWIFQIVRNEIANYFNQKSKYSNQLNVNKTETSNDYQEVCCFDKFINELPDNYKDVIELVYIDGKKQYEAAEILEISLANVKARIRRAKSILKQNFQECCKFTLNKNGDLIGEPNCSCCT